MPDRPTILVAEDDSGIREIARTRLEAADYQTHTACNGSEAMQRNLALRPHALILDVNMPKMDGFEVLEALAARQDVRRIPVMVLTARHDSADVRRAVQLGAKDYLTKPFSETQLLARVARLLARPVPATPMS